MTVRAEPSEAFPVRVCEGKLTLPRGGLSCEGVQGCVAEWDDGTLDYRGSGSAPGGVRKGVNCREAKDDG